MILGIDIGTTTVSGVSVEPQTKTVLRTATRAHGADVAGLPAGQHEQCPQTLLQTVLQVAEELCGSETPAGLVLSGQMHGIVAVDRELNPLTNLITWRDRRTADAPESVRRHAHAAETGCFLHPGYGGLTLHQLLKRNALPASTYRILSIQGFVQARLTGRCSIDETSAASWGLWNVCGQTWHEALIDELAIPRAFLPDYVPSCSVCGPVRAGFGALSGATVYSAVADNQAGVLGALAEEDSGNEAVVNVGTSGQISFPRHVYAFDPSMETRPMPGNGFIQVFATLCGGWAYQYLANFFGQVIRAVTGRDADPAAIFEAMSKMSDGDGTEGLRVDPRFAGGRTGGAGHTGLIYGITTENLTPQNLVRAFAEGIANELAAPLDAAGVTGLVAIGNGVRMNPVLRRAIERRFGMPCRLSRVQEAAAYGAVHAVLKCKPATRDEGGNRSAAGK